MCRRDRHEQLAAHTARDPPGCDRQPREYETAIEDDSRAGEEVRVGCERDTPRLWPTPGPKMSGRLGRSRHAAGDARLLDGYNEPFPDRDDDDLRAVIELAAVRRRYSGPAAALDALLA